MTPLAGAHPLVDLPAQGPRPGGLGELPWGLLAGLALLPVLAVAPLGLAAPAPGERGTGGGGEEGRDV